MFGKSYGATKKKGKKKIAKKTITPKLQIL
jgi:hypothetical protein